MVLSILGQNHSTCRSTQAAVNSLALDEKTTRDAVGQADHRREKQVHFTRRKSLYPAPQPSQQQQQQQQGDSMPPSTVAPSAQPLLLLPPPQGAAAETCGESVGASGGGACAVGGGGGSSEGKEGQSGQGQGQKYSSEGGGGRGGAPRRRRVEGAARAHQRHHIAPSSAARPSPILGFFSSSLMMEPRSVSMARPWSMRMPPPFVMRGLRRSSASWNPLGGVSYASAMSS